MYVPTFFWDDTLGTPVRYLDVGIGFCVASCGEVPGLRLRQVFCVSADGENRKYDTFYVILQLHTSSCDIHTQQQEIKLTKWFKTQ